MENNKINIAEILKECPPGMELYSPIFGDVYLNKIRPHLAIVVTTDKEQGDFKEEFLYDGRYWINGECMLFPSKDQRDWSKFQRPPFKDGDILYIDCTGDECFYKHNKYIFILKEISDGKIYCYCYIDEVNKYKKFDICWLSDMIYTLRFATEEEKQKLFKAIKENGYHWNAETKTLEKLIEPKFKVGDRIRCKNGIDKYGGLEEGIIEYIKDNTYGITIPYLVDIVTFINIADQDNWELVTLKFKKGDRIRHRIRHRIKRREEGVIKCVSFNFYEIFTTDEKSISISIGEQDEWELVPEIEPKFKDGDIISCPLTTCIFKKEGTKKGTVDFYCGVVCNEFTTKDINDPDTYFGYITNYRLATEEEKKKFFDVIRENGYKWNNETKTLEKLIVPKFKVGDKIIHKDCKNEINLINAILDNEYNLFGGGRILFKDQDNWELLSDEIKPKFKDGDIISDSLDICIFKREGNHSGTIDFYCGRDYIGNFVIKDSNKPDSHFGNIVDYKLATEEEKQKLFDAIGVNGLKWNAETKTLEKLIEPKFKFRRSRTANDLIEQFRKTSVNSLDILVVIDDKEIGDIQFVYDEKRKKYVFNLLLKD